MKKTFWKKVLNENKEAYRKLCESETGFTIFQKPFWLDAVCGNMEWSAVLYENKGRIVGAWPFCFVWICGGMRIIEPKMTQNMGPWIIRSNAKTYEKILSHEMEILTALIEELEKLPLLTMHQYFNTSFTNWLPLYWEGYKQTTLYSYRILDISDPETVRTSFSPDKKNCINRAIKANINIGFDISPKDFYENHILTLSKQGEKISYSYHFFERIHNAVYAEDSGRTIYAIDEQGNLHGALFILWDEFCAYDLISTLDPDYRNSGATSLLIYEMIKYLNERSPKVPAFDFEGSMIKGVEHSFRHFGTRQLPYFSISKEYKSKLMSTMIKIIGHYKYKKIFEK